MVDDGEFGKHIILAYKGLLIREMPLNEMGKTLTHINIQ